MNSESSRKRVLLTGASRGIGHATVKRFSDEGWQVLTCSRESIPEHYIEADLADPESLKAFSKKALSLIGEEPLHALVNNAAVSPKTPFKERLGVLNGGIEGWRQVFELNFFAPLALARSFAVPLRRGKGAIVNITSIAGHAIHPFAGSAYAPHGQARGSGSSRLPALQR